MVEEQKTLRVIVDADKCIGAGQCVRQADLVFDQDEDTGLVVLLDEDPPEHLCEAVRTAARVCPVGAITIVE